MARPPSRLREIVCLSRQGQILDTELDDEEISRSRTPAPASSQRQLSTPMPSASMLDRLLDHLDATVVAGWLKDSKTMMKTLRTFWQEGDNAYRLVCFLLDMRKEVFAGLVKVETEILREELCLAIFSAYEDDDIDADLYVLMRAVLREHPRRLTQDVLVRMLALVCLGETAQCKRGYRRLLGNIRCETSVREHVQWLLGTRAFAVVSVCHGTTRFFAKANSKAWPEATGDGDDRFEQSLSAVGVLFSAIANGRTDVVEFLTREKLIENLSVKDELGRTPLLAAAASGQDKTLNYILEKLQGQAKDCINLAGKSGNTPLQAAASNGSPSAVGKLLAAGADPNCWNAQCNGATALHMAVMKGDAPIVRLLLRAGANAGAKMGLPATTTPLDLAKDLGHTEIEQILMERFNLQEDPPGARNGTQ